MKFRRCNSGNTAIGSSYVGNLKQKCIIGMILPDQGRKFLGINLKCKYL